MNTTDLDLKTAEGVKALMESSTGSKNWNANCDKVKVANKGYPGFWYSTIILSGVAEARQATWK